MKTVRLILGIFSIGLIGGCASPHGGPICLYWMSSAVNACFPQRVSGTDGSSYETALKLHNYEKSTLGSIENDWVYRHRWMTQVPQPKLSEHGCYYDSEFMGRLQQSTERVGRRVYDIVRLDLWSGQRSTTYFDVTNYRYWYPKDD